MDNWGLIFLNTWQENQHAGRLRQAELNFLEIAKKIPRYGVDVHNATVNFLYNIVPDCFLLLLVIISDFLT